jgi:N-dimethylarginine dimethylaminohydrolase
MPQFNKTVLMSGVEFFDDGQAINPFMTQETPVDVERARFEHQQIRLALESAGVKVMKVEPPRDCQDGVYAANWALVRGETAVLAALPGPRKAEEAYAADTLLGLGKKVLRAPEGLKFSGQGDALPCGNLLFCGSNYRSDVEAQKFAAQVLGYDRIQLQTVPLLDADKNPVINEVSGWPDSFYYDIDLAISVLKPPVNGNKGLIAWCPAAFTAESQRVMLNLQAVDKIEVSEEEAKQAFACNLVSTGEVVIMSAHAPRFKADIESRGLKTITPEISELAKGGGYIRCTTLTLDND